MGSSFSISTNHEFSADSCTTSIPECEIPFQQSIRGGVFLKIAARLENHLRGSKRDLQSLIQVLPSVKEYAESICGEELGIICCLEEHYAFATSECSEKGTSKHGKVLLGSGSFCQVNVVQHRSSGTRYAAKILDLSQERCEALESRGMLGQCWAGLEGAINELVLASWVQGLNRVVSVHEVVVEPSRLILIQDLCSGGTLSEAIRRDAQRNQGKDTRHTGGGIPEPQAKQVMKAVLEALRDLHQRGFVHRDVKPENCLFERSGDWSSVKLCDFGHSVRIAGGLGTAAETSSNLHGSLDYAAPEIVKNFQFRGLECSSDIKHHSVDLWSAGVLLYVMMSGHLPFTSKDILSPVKNALRKKIEEVFRTPLWAARSAEVKFLILRLLSDCPKDRGTASEMLRDEWIMGYTRVR